MISRKVLVDEGLRQVVELDQAAIWKFLWWSGTISVHVLVDQNREDHSVSFQTRCFGKIIACYGCFPTNSPNHRLDFPLPSFDFSFVSSHLEPQFLYPFWFYFLKLTKSCELAGGGMLRLLLQTHRISQMFVLLCHMHLGPNTLNILKI